VRIPDLRGANIVEATLIGANLTGANLTGAYLYGTARDDWNVKGVKCTFPFWDSEGIERSPKDRDLEAGEFECLYAVTCTLWLGGSASFSGCASGGSRLVRRGCSER